MSPSSRVMQDCISNGSVHVCNWNGKEASTFHF